MIEIGKEYKFFHIEGTVLGKYDNSKCKVISVDKGGCDYIARMSDGKEVQVYENELSQY